MPNPGEVYYYPGYTFPDGEQRPKYVVLMGTIQGGDWVVARTTSRQNARPKDPPCNHGHPCPSFYVARASGIFQEDTWLALDRLDDHDAQELQAKVNRTTVKLIGNLELEPFCAALRCAAGAPDTTKVQERAMRDLRATLRCP